MYKKIIFEVTKEACHFDAAGIKHFPFYLFVQSTTFDFLNFYI